MSLTRQILAAFVVASFVLTTASVFAAAEGDGKTEKTEKTKRKKKTRKTERKVPAKLLKKFDKDGDGKLNEAERSALVAFRKENGAKTKARRAELLKKFDKNGDGKLDKTERQAARKAQSGERKKGGKGRKKGGSRRAELRQRCL